MKRVLAILIAAFTTSIYAAALQTNWEQADDPRSAVSPTMVAVEKDLQAGNRAALESFWQQVTARGTPFIEPISGDARHVLVTFLWRGGLEVKAVFVTGFLVRNGPAKEHRMTHLLNKDVWYKTYRLRSDARFSYQVAPVNQEFDDWDAAIFKAGRGDPLNPRHLYVELPAAPPQPWITRLPGVEKGRVEKQIFKSEILKNERSIWVYTPPGYEPNKEPYGLLLVFDGFEALTTLPTPVILDNLIAENRLPPMIAVLVSSPNEATRDRELTCYQPFTDFLAVELIPWVRKNYHVTSNRGQTLVSGKSYGGLAAAYAALKHPDIFGNVLCQSGSFAWRPATEQEFGWLIRQYVASPKLSLRFHLDVGRLETSGRSGEQPAMLLANRHMRDVLLAKGYWVDYQEFTGGHEDFSWRSTFPEGLIALVGKKR